MFKKLSEQFSHPCTASYQKKLALHQSNLEQRRKEIAGTDLGGFKTFHAEKEFKAMEKTLQQEYMKCLDRQKRSSTRFDTIAAIVRHYTN